MKQRDHRAIVLTTVAFVCGFSLMVFELAGARILAPAIGSSIYVWTSVIGVIIAALSLGYWVGGKLADMRGYMIDISRLTLAASLAILTTLVMYPPLLALMTANPDDPRTQGVIASLLLFAPTSFILGMIEPYLAKLNVRSLHTTGRSIASLSAFNSIGGITGTFTAGFVLFSFVGSRETLAFVAILLAIISWCIVPRVQWKRRAAVSMVVPIIIAAPVPATVHGVQIDTPSSHYTVVDTTRDGKGVRGLKTSPFSMQSGIFIDNPDELVFWYAKQIDAIAAATPARHDVLMLGGGAFTMPQHWAEKYPESTIDVVEIDPHLADIARQHFRYKDPKNVNLIFEDARTYVNHASKQYDIVIVDVYGDSHIPFTLITKEYGQRLNALVKPQGLVLANLVAGFEQGCVSLLNALDAPYRAHFPHAYFVANQTRAIAKNIVIAYSRIPRAYEGLQPLQLQTSKLYTDNYAPAEDLQYNCRYESKRRAI